MILYRVFLKKTLVSKGLHINMIHHSLEPNIIEWIVQFDDRLSKLEPPDATNRATTFYTGEESRHE
jgi:hypothetical protein